MLCILLPGRPWATLVNWHVARRINAAELHTRDPTTANTCLLICGSASSLESTGRPDTRKRGFGHAQVSPPTRTAPSREGVGNFHCVHRPLCRLRRPLGCRLYHVRGVHVPISRACTSSSLPGGSRGSRAHLLPRAELSPLPRPPSPLPSIFAALYSCFKCHPPPFESSLYPLLCGRAGGCATLWWEPYPIERVDVAGKQE